MKLIYKLLDIPFPLIFLSALVCLTLWAGITFLHVETLFVKVPVLVLTVYTALLVFYWGRIFLKSRQFREELEVWEVIQKKSMALALSMEMNLCFSAFYLYEAFSYHSSWFAFVAVFYLSLTMARFILLREFIFTNQSLISQYKRYIGAGYFMLVMMICLFVLTMIAFSEDYIVSYPGKSIYIASAFSFYLIINAIRGYIRYDKYKNPLLSGNQMISISAALLGILSLQTAYLPKLLESSEMIHNANLLTGCLIFMIMIFMSLYMIIHGGRTITFRLDENGERIR